MFCPLCKAEYRQGYTRCKDCDVELVPQLNSRSAAPRAEYESAVLLWRGGDPATFAALIGTLREAHIPLFDSLSHNPGVATSSPFPSPYDAASSFEVRVRPSDRKRAEHILDALLDQEPEDLDIAAAEGPVVAEHDLPDDWEPADATTEVWTGDDASFARTLHTCLRENGIPTRTVDDDPGRIHIFVRPEEADHACKILREITEGKPLT